MRGPKPSGSLLVSPFHWKKISATPHVSIPTCTEKFRQLCLSPSLYNGHVPCNTGVPDCKTSEYISGRIHDPIRYPNLAFEDLVSSHVAGLPLSVNVGRRASNVPDRNGAPCMLGTNMDTYSHLITTRMPIQVDSETPKSIFTPRAPTQVMRMSLFC
jgi:hypothetical protein